MNVDLTRRELNKILKEKFGEATFRLFYEESNRCWEERNNKKISELQEPPEKKVFLLIIDED